MQRYNPPQTSNQWYCQGCTRQIRKVQELMDERYLTSISRQIEKDALEARIKQLEAELAVEKGMKVLKAVDGDVGNELKEMKEQNEKLLKELFKVSSAPREFPLGEWKDAIEQKWREKYEQVREIAIEKNEEANQLDHETKEQRKTIRKIRRDFDRTVEVMTEQVDELKRQKELIRKMFTPSKAANLRNALSTAIENSESGQMNEDEDFMEMVFNQAMSGDQ